jgi:hypothetical protein
MRQDLVSPVTVWLQTGGDQMARKDELQVEGAEVAESYLMRSTISALRSCKDPRVLPVEIHLKDEAEA